MEAITLPIYNTQGKEVDTVKLDSSVFDGIINTAVIYQTICMYRANQRKGLASTKTMGEVSGGGRKPWRQKGTGRARVGSIRSPLWRGGGVTFGPHPRDYSYTIPKKIKKLALKSALCAKIKANNFIVLDDFKLGSPKTKEAVKIFYSLKLKPLRGILLLLDRIDNNLKIALRNINFLDVNLAKDTHAYEILAHQRLIVTSSALNELSKRLKK
ncbi:MAG: 50S ribosomal protein L4 [Candidatus Omnitrophica bacterium]|nr:50S ribosomal protein L4 [Candidatus Omnitrophota bacterium]MBU4345872.1 50S ribosomal protein L4 [Candidatus Omnitrophota bacterium]MBU4473071.1 50S ribosomal protein L4 [Candidatus Omnitrophota bacterium]